MGFLSHRKAARICCRVGNLLPTVTAEYILTSLRSPHFVSGSLNDKNQRLRRCWWVRNPPYNDTCGVGGGQECPPCGRFIFSIKNTKSIVIKSCKNGVFALFLSIAFFIDKTNACCFFIDFQTVYSCPPNRGGL